MKFKTIAALASAAALAVAGCGSSGDSASDPAPGNGTDRAFVAEMIPHHQSAVQMATIARKRGTSAFVKTLSANIIRTQNAEIQTMRAEDAQLADTDVPEGDLGMSHSMMGMSSDPSMLEAANPFDAAFLRMMIPHHEGAVEMAKLEISKGADPELQQLARNIISAQEKEITQMQQQLGG